MSKKIKRNSKLSKVPWELIVLVIAFVVIIVTLISLNLNQPLFSR